jgi:hypothetical protein
MGWMETEILGGLNKLLSLGLERAPPSESIKATALVWVEALTMNRTWDERRDTPRIRRAFIELGRTRETWPLPKHLLAALPPCTAGPALGRPHADPERVRRAMEEIAELLGVREIPPKLVSEPDRKTQAAGPDA